MSKFVNILRKLCITGLGSGYLPIAPGTWGSAVAATIYLPLYFSLSYASLNAILIMLIIISTIIGIFWGRWAIEYYKSNDPKQFVIDELAGMWVALLAMPLATNISLSKLTIILLTQFILFRLFDIIKPTPARQSENLPSGIGIMADDIIAGIYANITGQILFRIILSSYIS